MTGRKRKVKEREEGRKREKEGREEKEVREKERREEKEGREKKKGNLPDKYRQFFELRHGRALSILRHTE